MPKGEYKLEIVFEHLEKIFSGDQEYDEVCEALDIPVAQVRRSYPNLFKALKYPDRSGKAQQTDMPAGQQPVTVDMLERVLKNVAVRSNGTVPSAAALNVPVVDDGQAAIGDTSPEPPDIHMIKYSDWAVRDAHGGNVNDQWAVQWDIPTGEGKPVPPGVGVPFVLRHPEGGGRARFQVVNIIGENQFIIKKLAVLGRGQR